MILCGLVWSPVFWRSSSKTEVSSLFLFPIPLRVCSGLCSVCLILLVLCLVTKFFFNMKKFRSRSRGRRGRSRFSPPRRGRAGRRRTRNYGTLVARGGTRL